MKRTNPNNPEVTARANKKYYATPKGKYAVAKRNALNRGVPWEFTFETWWKVWEDHYDNRGGEGPHLCMCREGDEGPYSPDNVRIDTMANNVSEARQIQIKRKTV